MSAEDQGSAVNEVAVPDNGPQIITVVGQEGHVPAETEVKIEPPVVEEKPAVKAAGSEEQESEETRDAKGRFKPGVQDRIDQLTRARREAERDVEYWKAKATGTVAQNPAQAAPEVPKPPVRADFQTEELYVDAMTDYKVDQKVAEKLAQHDTRQREVQSQVEKANTWQSQLEAARVDIPNFNEVMDAAEVPVADHVADLIMQHEQGAKVAHHLAIHPEALDKINEMSPAKAAFEIAKLAVQFDTPAPASSSKPAAAEQVSKAPPPAARNVGAGRSTETALGDMSMDDYIAKRKSQGASWAR